MLKLFIIGSGHVAKQFASTVLKNKDLLFSGIVLDNIDDKTEISAQFESVNIYDDFKTLLKDKDISGSLVIVVTPPHTHFEICDKLLDQKCHILCEKPLAVNFKEAKLLADKAKRLNLVNSCTENRLLNFKPIGLARDYILNKKLGQIYLIEQKGINRLNRPGIEWDPKSIWYLDKTKAGGGPFIDWGVYDLAILYFLLDGIKSINIKHAIIKDHLLPRDQHLKHTYTVEDHGIAVSQIILESNEKISFIHERAMAFHGKSKLEMRICGTKGGIEMNWFIENPSFNFYYYDEKKGMENETCIIDKNYNFDTGTLQSIIDCVLNNTKPEFTFDNAAKHLKYIEDFYSIANSNYEI